MKITVTLFLMLIVLTNQLKAVKYYGAEYRTKEAFTYGRFEASIKSAQRDGMLASFFTYHDGTGTSTWNEIDIEILGRYTNSVQFNTITPGQTNHVRTQPVNFNPASDYHTYAFEWTPEYVAWFIDGEEVYRQTGKHIQTLTRAQKIMMNIWNPTYPNWVGIWNENTVPAFASYDFVSYYSYTPDSGSYGTGSNFTHQWTDNLDFWDQSRWEKATHTWNGNGCTFVHENALISDGKLTLCLTDSNTGYTDKTSPFFLWARATTGKIIAGFTEELDKSSAEDKTKYLIPGLTIDSVRLMTGNKNVEIFASKIDLSKSYKLLVLAGIKDAFTPANLSASRSLDIHMPKTPDFPIKINAGGTEGAGFLADQEFSAATEYGYAEGANAMAANDIQIAGTDEDDIYRSERYGLVSYKIRLPNGLYNIKLLMAENHFSETGSRVFDIYLENELVIDNLDIFKMAGKNTAYDLTFQNIQVEDEILEIYFAAEIDNALLNGIVIEKSSTEVPDYEDSIPAGLRLLQNYPNPFNPSTVIKYSIPEINDVKMNVYNLLGEHVTTLVNERQDKGNYEVNFDASMLSAGIYFYKVQAGKFTEIRKMIFLK